MILLNTFLHKLSLTSSSLTSIRVALFACTIIVATTSFQQNCCAHDTDTKTDENSKNDDRPNIIVIISDDAGNLDFGFQGSKDVKTPHLDSLADTGIRFTQGYVSSSVCSPSRAGLLTGRYQQRFGHELNIPPRSSDSNGLPLSEVTLAKALKSSNMRTLALGKWHLGYAEHFHPLSRGFDHYYGFLQGARSYWPMEKPTVLNQLLLDRDPVKESFTYMTDELGQAAADYIDKHHEQPMFMYLCYNAVHTPMHATESDLADVTVEGTLKRKKLIAMTNALDRSVGKVLEALDRHGLTENTIVFFVNDNGGATNNDSDNGSLRGRKGSPFEGGIRVPFLAKWPKRWKSGVEFAHPVSTLDIFPTALAAAGIVDGPFAELELDGVDLNSFLENGKALSDSRPHETMYWRRGEDWAVRHGDLKLLSDNNGAPMLFDLAKDESEMNDLAAAQPEKVKELTELFSEWQTGLVDPKWSYGNRKQNQKKKNKK